MCHPESHTLFHTTSTVLCGITVDQQIFMVKMIWDLIFCVKNILSLIWDLIFCTKSILSLVVPQCKRVYVYFIFVCLIFIASMHQ